MALPEENHAHDPLTFPEGFIWGSATASFQVEGNNINSDWWEWEKRKEPIEKHSGVACDQYNRYPEDIKLLKNLGHQAYRMSIEWSRIEPENGIFNQDAIDHYIDELKLLKESGITVMLTLHHFSNPMWFSKKGGWLSFRAVHYFERFVKKVAPLLAEYVDFWVTLNEYPGYVFDAYGRGKFPPNVSSRPKMIWAMWNMSQAHKKAYKVIHKFDKKAKVGVAHNITSYNALHKHSFRENIAVWLLDLMGNHALYWLTGIGTHDFLGINYYYNCYLDGRNSFVPRIFNIEETKKDVSDLGWEVRPEGIFDVLMDFSDYRKPMYITENGIASTNDDRRVRFLLSFLKEVYHAIAAGANIRGYFYWSLMDNYEWVEGFKPRFGLVAIDFDDDLKRIPRPSAYVYREIIQNNGIPHDLLKLLGHSIRVEEVVKIDK